jgi:hypothetical protein
VIKERVVFPFLIGCQVVKLRGKREQLLSFSHRWEVVVAVKFTVFHKGQTIARLASMVSAVFNRCISWGRRWK